MTYFRGPSVLFALRREAKAFRRLLGLRRWLDGAPCRACLCGPVGGSVLILETGVGPARTHQVLDWLLSRPSLGELVLTPQVIISAGYSGALGAALEVGDIIVGNEVVDADGGCWPAPWPRELPDTQVPLRRGRLLTMKHLVADPSEKLALAEKHSALAVDMETAAVAARCHAAGIPCGCVRAISDDARRPLSHLDSLLVDGRVSPWRLLACLARQPRLLAELCRLAGQTRLASDRLALALGELVK